MIGRRVDLIIINKATSESYAYYIWLLGAKIRKTFKKEKKEGKKSALAILHCKSTLYHYFIHFNFNAVREV